MSLYFFVTRCYFWTVQLNVVTTKSANSEPAKLMPKYVVIWTYHSICSVVFHCDFSYHIYFSTVHRPGPMLLSSGEARPLPLPTTAFLFRGPGTRRWWSKETFPRIVCGRIWPHAICSGTVGFCTLIPLSFFVYVSSSLHRHNTYWCVIVIIICNNEIKYIMLRQSLVIWLYWQGSHRN